MHLQVALALALFVCGNSRRLIPTDTLAFVWIVWANQAGPLGAGGPEIRRPNATRTRAAELIGIPKLPYPEDLGQIRLGL
jgi:hypothetical protein